MCESGTIELACLGRPFQLGMLYDCRSDALIPGISLWDYEMLKKNINTKPQPNTDFKIIASDSSEDKVAALSVSASLEASFMSGLVSVKGSGDYLNNNKKSKHHSRVTLQYRTTARFEQLTMEHLGAGNVKHCNVFQEGSATHVVTGLLYGAQAFFVFDREVSSNENHREIQGDLQAVIKKIPSISIEGQASLKMNEKEQENINKFSCTFHGDFALDNNPVSYVDAIKVYSELPKLLGEHGENAVPMTVWLYPLKKLDSAAAQLVREISVSIIRHAQQIMDELYNCDIQCQDLMRDSIAIQFPEIKDKIKKFKDLLLEYKTVLQKHLSRLLPSIRGGGKEEQELADYLNRNERSPFKGALLTKYLNEQEQEMNVVRSYLDIMKDVPVISSSNELDRFVLKDSNNYVITFALSSLNEDEPYLSDLENHLKEQSCNNGEKTSYNQNSSEKKQKWFCSGDVRAFTRKDIQNFLDFKEANKGRKNIEFCISPIPDELSTATSIHVYEKGGMLVSSQYKLPSKPPKPIFLSAEHDCICLQIKPPDHGVSSVDSYCISYQSAQSSEWTEVFTDGVADQFTVKPLKSHQEYCFTCKAVCRPGVSLASDTTSFFRTRPCSPPGAPTIKKVESEAVTLVWDVPTSVGEGVLITGYKLEFRECTKEHENEKPWKSVKSTNREYIVEGLKSETDYTVKVLAICFNGEVSLPSSETVFSACLNIEQSAEVGSGKFKNQSSRISKENPSIYRLELHQKMKENDFNQYVFGRKVEDVKNKVILLLGSTGAGKTTLINVMANYILGVEWQDPHRFKLINEVTNRTQAESQTSNVSSYELYSQPGFQIPYSLTIVDTPGYGDTKGIAQDKLITKQLQSFLCSPLGIDHIDAVCLVVQASLVRLSANQKYIFDSVLSIFGKDMAENIIILVTFADGKDVPALEAIKAADLPCQKNKNGQPTHFKFNNTALYANKRVEKHTATGSNSDDDEDDGEKLNEIVWKSSFKQMKAFFKTLGNIEGKDLTLTIKVLEERERLEKAMKSLTPQITAGLSKVSEIKKFKECLQNQSDRMNENENFEQEIEVMKASRSPATSFTMNCNTCFFTCHSNCFLPAEDPLQACAVMKNDYCIICPGKCHYSFHSRENFMWTYETKVETKTIKELKENFMAAKGTFMNTTQMLKELDKDLSAIWDSLKNLIKQSSDCLKRLDEIALKPTSLSTGEYLEILIKTEKEEKSPGFEDRIVELEKIKKEAVLLEKIARGDNPLEEPGH